MEKDIPLIDALTGFSFKINHLDDRAIIIESKKGDIVKIGDIKEIAGLGMPIYSRTYEHGSLYIKFNIIFPESLTREQIVGLKTVFVPTPEPIVDEETQKITAIPFDPERLKQRTDQREREAYNEDSDEGANNGGFRTSCNPQ